MQPATTATTITHRAEQELRQLGFMSSSSPMIRHSDPQNSLSSGVRISEKVRHYLQLNGRLGDLGLMHHYVLAVPSILYIKSDHTRFFWQETFPVLSVENEFLIHGALALASIHLAHHKPQDREFLIKLSMVHQARAMPAFRSGLANLNPANSQAVYLFSLILSLYTFARPQLSSLDPVSDPITELQATMTVIRGTKAIIEKAKWWFNPNGSLNPMGASTQDRWVNSTLPPSSSMQETFARLEAFNEQNRSGEYYPVAIQCLRSAFAEAFLDPDKPRLIFFWPIYVEDAFMIGVQQRKPLALALMAHYAILIYTLQGLWWSDVGYARRLVEEIVKKGGEEVMELVAWPGKRIGEVERGYTMWGLGGCIAGLDQ